MALSTIKEGDVVLDLGSGAGFDAFLAAKKVGNKGKVIGLDMSEEITHKAKENAKMYCYQNFSRSNVLCFLLLPLTLCIVTDLVDCKKYLNPVLLIIVRFRISRK